MTDLDKQSATPPRAACIHGRYEICGEWMLDWSGNVLWCPGGREVTERQIDRAVIRQTGPTSREW